ncbi:unnamed protein product [Polarella glacialis]|uniref:Uncharacterized protein n=1 Tax=Polarella glacialis TaxID=89957 RepID=A0A813H0Q3_POLGL|nr:unnamed protein product [Polarella glacialis]
MADPVSGRSDGVSALKKQLQEEVKHLRLVSAAGTRRTRGAAPPVAVTPPPPPPKRRPPSHSPAPASASPRLQVRRRSGPAMTPPARLSGPADPSAVSSSSSSTAAPPPRWQRVEPGVQNDPVRATLDLSDSGCSVSCSFLSLSLSGAAGQSSLSWPRPHHLPDEPGEVVTRAPLHVTLELGPGPAAACQQEKLRQGGQQQLLEQVPEHHQAQPDGEQRPGALSIAEASAAAVAAVAAADATAQAACALPILDNADSPSAREEASAIHAQLAAAAATLKACAAQAAGAVSAVRWEREVQALRAEAGISLLSHWQARRQQSSISACFAGWRWRTMLRRRLERGALRRSFGLSVGSVAHLLADPARMCWLAWRCFAAAAQDGQEAGLSGCTQGPAGPASRARGTGSTSARSVGSAGSGSREQRQQRHNIRISTGSSTQSNTNSNRGTSPDSPKSLRKGEPGQEALVRPEEEIRYLQELCELQAMEIERLQLHARRASQQQASDIEALNAQLELATATAVAVTSQQSPSPYLWPQDVHCFPELGSQVQLLAGRSAGAVGTVTRAPDIMGTISVQLQSGEDLYAIFRLMLQKGMRLFTVEQGRQLQLARAMPQAPTLQRRQEAER